MAFRVVPTESFESEYSLIVDYIANILAAPKAAGDLISSLDRVRVELSDNPFLHAVSRKARLADLELRERLVRGYVVVYRIAEGTVYLEHIFHQSQDFESAL